MLTPTIHMNGTSRADLLAQHVTALDAVDTAIAALRAATPNGRDFYPQGERAHGLALTEHFARVARLESVRAEVQQIAEALA